MSSARVVRIIYFSKTKIELRVSKDCGFIVWLLSKVSELEPITKVANYSQESMPVDTLMRLSKYRTQKNKICILFIHISY